MATTRIDVEAQNTDIDRSFGDKRVRVMEMRLIAQNKGSSSITNPNDKRTEDIRAPFSEIINQNNEGNQGDIII